MAGSEDVLEDLISHLGDFGRYQCFQMFLFMLAALTAGIHMLSLVTTAAVPEHRCYIPWLDKDGPANWSSPEVLAAIPLTASGDLSTCVYLDPASNATIACDRWVYDDTYYANTRATQWDLVCDKRWMGALAQSAYIFGVFVGAVASGSLADKYGRKLIFCWAALLQIIVSIGITFINNYHLYIATLTIYGAVGSAGAFVTAFVLTMEFSGPSVRTAAGLIFQAVFAVGIMLVAAWASAIHDGTKLQLIYGAHSLLLAAHWWLIDESPRWLWSQGRISECVNIVAKGIKFNRGPKIDKAYYVSKGKAKKDTGGSQESAGFMDLFRTPRLRMKTLNIGFNCFANSMVYYGLSLNSNKMEGNPFVNMFILALVELPCCITVITLLDRTGRRSLLSIFLLLGGAACTLTAFIPPEMSNIVTGVTFFGKFAIAGSFSIIFNYSAELFPTVVRNTGIGFGSMCARAAAMLTPVILLLDVIDPKIPIVLFGSMALLSGFFTLFLPETLHQPMPHSIQDGETFGVGDTAFVNGCCPKKRNQDDGYIPAKPV